LEVVNPDADGQTGALKYGREETENYHVFKNTLIRILGQAAWLLSSIELCARLSSLLKVNSFWLNVRESWSCPSLFGRAADSQFLFEKRQRIDRTNSTSSTFLQFFTALSAMIGLMA
jgi:hypothetical protein